MSQFEFLSFHNLSVWVVEFCHNLSFVIIWVVTIWVLSQFEFCHNLSFEFCHKTFWVTTNMHKKSFCKQFSQLNLFHIFSLHQTDRRTITLLELLRAAKAECFPYVLYFRYVIRKCFWMRPGRQIAPLATREQKLSPNYHHQTTVTTTV